MRAQTEIRTCLYLKRSVLGSPLYLQWNKPLVNSKDPDESFYGSLGMVDVTAMQAKEKGNAQWVSHVLV